MIDGKNQFGSAPVVPASAGLLFPTNAAAQDALLSREVGSQVHPFRQSMFASKASPPSPCSTMLALPGSGPVNFKQKKATP